VFRPIRIGEIPREHEVGESIGIDSLLGGLGDAEGLFRGYASATDCGS